MELRIGIGYEQEEPGLFLYDAETGLVVLSSDTENRELAVRINGALVTPEVNKT